MGAILERSAERFTPAGLPVVEFKLTHQSQQVEAGSLRKVDCEIACIALGNAAKVMSATQPGDKVKLEGFLASRSLRIRTPVLHVNKIEFLEGN